MKGMDTTIRRGGKQTPDGFLFELSGGDLSVDFVNTVDCRPTESPRELLPNAHELYSWSRQAGLLSRKQEEALQAAALRRPSQAESARRKAIAIRECLYRMLQHLTDGKPVPRELVSEWNGYAHRALQNYKLAPAEEGLAWLPDSEPAALDSVLWPVVHAAVGLLTGPHAGRIRRCAAEKCDWVFLDTSKRGNRRWCDMSVCGNRAKAQRFYRRSKGK